jgi:pyruvate decarboxylase
LSSILGLKNLRQPRDLQLVELVVDKLDTSWKLGTTLAWRNAEHRKYLKEEGVVDTYGNWGLETEEEGKVKWF